MKYEIGKELKKWDERVLFNVQFKANTKANLERLNEILRASLESFTVIGANSESLVYKIARYFISKNVRNGDITFIEGKVVESYIGDDSAQWKKKERVDDFFEIFGEEYKNKWVLIPYINFEINTGLAIYFISKFKKYGAIGLIMYAEGPSNLTEVLSLESNDPFFYEFPVKKYRKRKPNIEDDEW